MSQCSAILSHMKKYGSIESLTALNLYGSFRLAARINELRMKGHDIDTERVKKGDSVIARYHLVK